MSIPAGLSQYLFALHRLISRQHILDNTGQHMTDMRLAVSGRRTIIKGKGITVLADFNTLLSYIIFLPEVQNFLFSLHKVKICVYLIVHCNSS